MFPIQRALHAMHKYFNNLTRTSVRYILYAFRVKSAISRIRSNRPFKGIVDLCA